MLVCLQIPAEEVESTALVRLWAAEIKVTGLQIVELKKERRHIARPVFGA